MRAGPARILLSVQCSVGEMAAPDSTFGHLGYTAAEQWAQHHNRGRWAGLAAGEAARRRSYSLGAGTRLRGSGLAVLDVAMRGA